MEESWKQEVMSYENDFCHAAFGGCGRNRRRAEQGKILGYEAFHLSLIHILFEAATFYGPNIRKSAKRIGMRTEASGIFEKGLDPVNAAAAIDRACQLIEELGCGEVVGGMVDVCEPIKPLRKIAFEPEKINRFLGTDIPEEDMLKTFRMLELSYDPEAGEITIPSFRQDLEGFADIAEEVARFYGYDKIPTLSLIHI